MLNDTEDAFDEALETLGKALDTDRRFPEAIALSALIHTLRGVDLQEEGRRIQAEGGELINQMNALKNAVPATVDSG